jgi:hypothetical protein
VSAGNAKIIKDGHFLGHVRGENIGISELYGRVDARAMKAFQQVMGVERRDTGLGRRLQQKQERSSQYRGSRCTHCSPRFNSNGHYRTSLKLRSKSVTFAAVAVDVSVKLRRMMAATSVAGTGLPT